MIDIEIRKIVDMIETRDIKKVTSWLGDRFHIFILLP